MLNLIAFGLAVGAGIQAWRAWPADGPLTASSAAVVLAVAVACAYLGGRWHGRGRGSSYAHAEAHAEAHSEASASNVNHVQVAVVMPGEGAGTATGVRLPTAAAPWMVGATDRAELSPDDLEGMDLTELLEAARETDDTPT